MKKMKKKLLFGVLSVFVLMLSSGYCATITPRSATREILNQSGPQCAGRCSCETIRDWNIENKGSYDEEGYQECVDLREKEEHEAYINSPEYKQKLLDEKQAELERKQRELEKKQKELEEKQEAMEEEARIKKERIEEEKEEQEKKKEAEKKREEETKKEEKREEIAGANLEEREIAREKIGPKAKGVEMLVKILKKKNLVESRMPLIKQLFVNSENEDMRNIGVYLLYLLEK